MCLKCLNICKKCKRKYTEDDIYRRYAVFQSNYELCGQVHVTEKTQEEIEHIKRALENNDFISKVISGDMVSETIAAMYKRYIHAGEIIIKEGNTGSHMYVNYNGTFEISTTKSNAKITFSDGRVFGELVIVYDVKRTATVKAITGAVIWVLDAPVYQQLLRRHNVQDQYEKENFLIKTEVLKDANADVLKMAANSLRSEFFAGGKTIIKEGDKGNKFYIIRAGTVSIHKEQEGNTGIFGKGYYFGNLSIVEETKKQATVTANPPCVECLTLSKKQFLELTEYLKLKPPPILSKVSNEFEYLNLNDLQIVNVIGEGGFGRIELVRNKENKKQMFALKIMTKHSIVRSNRQQQALNEKLQLSCNSPFITKMYKTFKDNLYVYYLLEYSPGGDLWNLLYKEQPERRFIEKDAKFIIGCVLEALDYLHQHEIIYRDLKPENVLLTTKGYFQITDFGYSKKLAKYDKTFTFSGTVEYVAPEMIRKQQYDRTVDYWSCGIFIFELLCGKTPFSVYGGNENKIFKNILSGIDSIEFPTVIKNTAKDLITKLLNSNPAERLGESNGVTDIKSDKWFSGFNWSKLQKLEMETPFKIHSRIYRSLCKTERDIPPEETSGWDYDF